MAERATSIVELLERVPTEEEGQRIALGEILDVVGQRTFGPLLL